MRLPATVRRHLEVATAGAWEALAEAHAQEALRLVGLVGEDWSFDESIDYYFQELGITGTLATTVRNRALVQLEEEERLDPSRPSMHLRDEAPAELEGEGNGRPGSTWQKLRPDRLVKELRQRQRRAGEAERIADLVVAQAEEEVIQVHVENGLDFVALLDEQMSADRAVSYYVDAIGLSGCRAQTVVQRAMARIADALLEPHERPRGGVTREPSGSAS